MTSPVINHRLALLVCDTPIPTVVAEHGEYPAIFARWLKASLPTSETVSHELTLDAFDVVHKGEYPNFESLGNRTYEGIIITGSAASAYAPLEWIPPLIHFIQEVAKSCPRIRLIGICFGHQVIARAFGGECVPNPRGWEVATTNVEMTGVGKEFFGVDVLRIHQMHRDHVPSLPDKFHLLGSTDACLVQGMLLPYDPPSTSTSTSTTSNTTKSIATPRNAHVLTVQGHPEFSPSIVGKIVDAREASGAMNADVVKMGRRQANLPDDGVGTVGALVWKMLKVE